MTNYGLTPTSTPKEVRTAWVKALRSDDYAQGIGQLCQGDRFCCLGVLCDLAVKAGVAPPWVASVWGFGIEYPGHATNYSLLPPTVADWAGVSTNPMLLLSAEDRVTHGTRSAHATWVNDDLRREFGAIADAIERTFKETS